MYDYDSIPDTLVCPACECYMSVEFVDDDFSDEWTIGFYPVEILRTPL